MTQQLFCEKTKMDAWKKASAKLKVDLDNAKSNVKDKSPAWNEGYRTSLLHSYEMAAWDEEFDDESFVGEPISLKYLDEGIEVIKTFKWRKDAREDNLSEALFPLVGQDAMDYLEGCQAAYNHALKLLQG